MPSLHSQYEIVRSDGRGIERTRNRIQHAKAVRLKDRAGTRIDGAAWLGSQTRGEDPAAARGHPGMEQRRRDRTAAQVAHAYDV